MSITLLIMLHSATIDIPLKRFLSNATFLREHLIVTSESVDKFAKHVRINNKLVWQCLCDGWFGNLLRSGGIKAMRMHDTGGIK